MSTILQIITFTHIIIISFLYLTLPSPSQATFVRTIEEEATQELGLDFKKEKVSHLRFYWHDILSGPRPTSVRVYSPTKKSRTGFGTMNMIDNPLTEEPKLSSKLVGRAQGFYALDSQQKDVELLMAMNFVFMEGKYNESSFMVLGQNVILNKVREMPVIGGSGLFRFARGYVQARTYTLNSKSIDVTVQYDCYVMHY